jgi:hypothetical protein
MLSTTGVPATILVTSIICGACVGAGAAGALGELQAARASEMIVNSQTNFQIFLDIFPP